MRAWVNLAMMNISVVELQSALRKSIYFAPAIADQLRYMRSFDVLAYVPRDATFAASDMTALPLRPSSRLLADRAAPRSE